MQKPTNPGSSNNVYNFHINFKFWVSKIQNLNFYVFKMLMKRNISS